MSIPCGVRGSNVWGTVSAAKCTELGRGAYAVHQFQTCSDRAGACCVECGAVRMKREALVGSHCASACPWL